MPIEIESPEELGYETIKFNLAESSVTDQVLDHFKVDMEDLVLAYGSHKGLTELRKLVVEEEPTLTEEDVLICAGAASALFIVYTAMLEKEDHVIVVDPNYSTNLEIPRSIGCGLSSLELKFENKWSVDINSLKSLITQRTKLISLTTPHNPTGTLLPADTLKEIISIAEDQNIYVLLDETYRDLCFTEKASMGAAFSKNLITVSSVSKALGLPGLRIGWIINKDTDLMEKFLAAKEQIFICNSVVDEKIALKFLQKKTQLLEKVLSEVTKKRQLVSDWILNHKVLEWVQPEGGVVGFARIKENIDVDIDLFYKRLLQDYSTYVGPGHWFGLSKRYFLIGFGWPYDAELEDGLKNIDQALEKSIK